MDSEFPQCLEEPFSQFEIKILRNIGELKPYRDAWANLLRQNNNDNAFIEFDWVEKWWNFLGDGYSMFVLCVLERGEAIGFCPLMTRKRGFHREINFIGYPQSSYMDFILNGKRREACINLIVNYLLKLRGSYILSLHGMLEDSPNFKLLKDYLIQSNIHYSIKRVESPYIKIDKTFKDYYKDRSGHNSIKMLNSRERRLREAGKLTYEELDPERIDEIFELHEKRWKNKRDTSNFSKGRIYGFFKELALEKNLDFDTCVTVLKLGERIIAFNYSFLCNGKYSGYRIAHDNDFSIFSPGKIIVKEVIKECFDRGIETFDFGLGDVNYKHEWTDNKEGVYKFTFPVDNIPSKLIYRRRCLKEKLFNVLKKSKGIVYFKQNIFDRIKYLISGKNPRNLMAESDSIGTNKGGEKKKVNIIKKAWDGIYSDKEYTIFEKDLNRGQGSGKHLENGIHPLQLEEGYNYTINEANINDLDILCEAGSEEISRVVNRFYRKQRCFVASDGDKALNYTWIDTREIEISEIEYKVGLEKNRACICRHFTDEKHGSVELEVNILNRINKTLSENGFIKCYIAVDGRNQVLKNNVLSAGFKPVRQIDYKRLFGKARTKVAEK